MSSLWLSLYLVYFCSPLYAFKRLCWQYTLFLPFVSWCCFPLRSQQLITQPPLSHQSKIARDVASNNLHRKPGAQQGGGTGAPSWNVLYLLGESESGTVTCEHCFRGIEITCLAAALGPLACLAWKKEKLSFFLIEFLFPFRNYHLRMRVQLAGCKTVFGTVNLTKSTHIASKYFFGQ